MKKIVLSSGCLLIAAFFAANNSSAQSKDDLKAKIEKLDGEMDVAMVSGNIEKSLDFYAPDAIAMPNHGKMLVGLDAIKKSNEEMKNTGSKILSFQTTPVEINSYGNIITEIGKYKVKMSMAGKSDPADDMGKYLTIWEKEKDGSLKVKVEIWNTDSNPMSDMQKTGSMDKMNKDQNNNDQMNKNQ